MDGASVGFDFKGGTWDAFLIPIEYGSRPLQDTALLLPAFSWGGGGRAKPFLDPGGRSRLGLGFVPPEAGRNRRPPPERRVIAGRLFFYISAGSPSQETAASAEDTAYGENGISWRRDAQGTRREAKEKAQIKSELCVCRAEASDWYPVGESNPCSRRERAVS